MTYTFALIALFLGASVAFGQAHESIYTHAHLTRDTKGRLILRVTGNRPLLQAITAVRRHYGWITDYEESEPDEKGPNASSDGVRQLTGKTLTLVLHEPLASSSEEERRTLKSMIRPFRNDATKERIDESLGNRMSIAIQSRSRPLLLDALITLPPADRSVDEAVSLICNAAADTLGKKCLQGGIVNNDLTLTRTAIGSVAPVEARELLARVLDATRDRKVWLVAYEPAFNGFVIGIQAAVHLQEPVEQPTEVQTIPQPVKH